MVRFHVPFCAFAIINVSIVTFEPMNAFVKAL